MKNTTTTTNAHVATQTAHTPAPWIQDATPAHAPCSFIIRSKSAHCDAWVPVRMNDSANSKRIVACVNACESMADPAVEIAGLRSRSNSIEGMCAEVERLRGVNTDLLVSLQSLALSYEVSLNSKTSEKVWQAIAKLNLNFARAAIAKATGGAK